MPIFLLVCLLSGCASPGDGNEAGVPTEESSDLAKQVAGEWLIEDDQMGSMRLRVNGDLECVLTDARGKTFEFEGDEEGEGFQAEVDVGERGLKVLINQPATSLEVAGSMNYSMGSAVLMFTPVSRDGQRVLWCEIYRESRPDDTRRSINLLPLAPTEAGSE